MQRCQQYQQELYTKIENNDDKKWNKLCETMKETAKNAIGIVKPTKHKTTTYSDKIELLSKEQRTLKIEIDNSNDARKIPILRNQRNQLLKEIKKEQNALREKEIAMQQVK